MSADPQPPFDSPAPHPGTSIAPGSGLPSKTAAGLASLFSIVGGAIFYFVDRRDAFVRYQSVQAILLGLILIAFTLTTELGYFVFGHIWFIGFIFIWVIRFVSMVFELIWMALWIITTFCAFQGRQWQVPYLAPVVRRLSARGPGV